MPRSTLRCASIAGALCLTATTATAASAAAETPAHATNVGVSTKRLNVRSGSRVTVTGRVQASGPMTAALQIKRHARWITLDRDRTGRAGRYVLRDRIRRTLSAPVRVRLSDGLTRKLGRLNVYRTSYASWYGPGLYGNRLGCGGTLTAGRLGVAHKSLPCGAKVTLRHGGRVVRVPVIDRGPYVSGREFDLTAATAQRLHFSGHGAIQVAN
jgi:rare lipoprotein A (peptidoglycan hydrolase)